MLRGRYVKLEGWKLAIETSVLTLLGFMSSKDFTQERLRVN
jgi:hypothetical protein